MSGLLKKLLDIISMKKYKNRGLINQSPAYNFVKQITMFEHFNSLKVQLIGIATVMLEQCKYKYFNLKNNDITRKNNTTTKY